MEWYCGEALATVFVIACLFEADLRMVPERVGIVLLAAVAESGASKAEGLDFDLWPQRLQILAPASLGSLAFQETAHPPAMRPNFGERATCARRGTTVHTVLQLPQRAEAMRLARGPA
jgi:hypothetical protein